MRDESGANQPDEFNEVAVEECSDDEDDESELRDVVADEELFEHIEKLNQDKQ